MSKLNEASEHVASLKEKAGVQSTLLAEKQEEADQALKAITTAMEVSHVFIVVLSVFTTGQFHRM